TGPTRDLQHAKDMAQTENQIQDIRNDIVDSTNKLTELDGQRVEQQEKILALQEKQRLELLQQRRIFFDLGQETSDLFTNLLYGQGSLKENLQQFGRNFAQSYTKPIFDTVFKQALGKVDLGVDLGGLADFVGNITGTKQSLPKTGLFG